VKLLVAGMLFVVLEAYAIFGGADFGAGFWDLTAGGAVRGREPRALIDAAIGPVWEANHVWLIFVLVIAWTAFGAPFVAVMRSLYVPLGLAALGIVLRGSGFAFRKVSVRTAVQRATGATFALSSILTPFFFGTVVGAIATGRVPSTGGTGPLVAWFTPASMFTGALTVAMCAYLAGVFLTAEARTRGLPHLEEYFRLRALGMAIAAGAVSVGGLVVVRTSAPRLFDRLLGPALPLVAVSVLAGGGVVVAIRRVDPRLVRVLAAGAVAALIAGWGVAQYPYFLGTHLPLARAAAPGPTLVAVAIIFVAAALLCLPSLGVLFLLHTRGSLESA
jgi:cytochrome d ubiquinol oxidase subunit II